MQCLHKTCVMQRFIDRKRLVIIQIIPMVPVLPIIPFISPFISLILCNLSLTQADISFNFRPVFSDRRNVTSLPFKLSIFFLIISYNHFSYSFLVSILSISTMGSVPRGTRSGRKVLLRIFVEHGKVRILSSPTSRVLWGWGRVKRVGKRSDRPAGGGGAKGKVKRLFISRPSGDPKYNCSATFSL